MSGSSSSEEKLYEAVDAFVEALLAGEPVDVESWMKRHPDLGDALRDELELVASLHQTAASVAMDAAGEDAEEVAAPSGRRFLGRGEQLGEHVIEELLGYGGMGEVYRAHHDHLQKTVAIKVLRPFLADDPAAVRRFREEVKAQATLRPHRNVVTAMHASEHEGRLYLVMEHVDGEDLAKLVRRDGPLSPDAAVDYLRQAAEGLAHAHAGGLVHRDVKPSNLLVDRDGTLRLVDLGLARLAIRDQEGDGRPSFIDELVGTLDYVAPEQARDPSAADARSDLYGLGCTFYYLLTGRAPFADRLMLKKLMAHAMETPTPLVELRDDLPAGLVVILERLMAKDPDARFASADALVDAVDALEIDEVRASLPSSGADGQAAGHTAPGEVVSDGVDWRTVAVIAIAVAVLAVLGLVISHRPGGGVPPGDAGPPPTPSAEALPAFGVQAPQRGRLAEGDDVRPKEGSFFHRLAFTAAPETTYAITLRSIDFDPVLVLRDAEGFELATSHDAPGLGRAAEVVVDPGDETAELVVLVSSERSRKAGEYLLSARAVTESFLSPGGPAEGNLEEGDALYHEDDTLYDRWALRVSAGETYVVVMAAEVFAPAVFVENADGRRLTQSEALETGGRARTVFDATSDGLVYVLANTAALSDGGAYSLSVETERSGEELLRTTGLLAEGDARARDESYYDPHPFAVLGGQTYVVTMQSEDFDTYLLLVDPATEERLAANDDAFGTDSRLVWTASGDGTVEAWANAYLPGATGQYQLEIRALGK